MTPEKLEESIKYASENKESYSIGGGWHHGWGCDDEFYKRHEKDIDRLMKKYGFRHIITGPDGKPQKMKNSDKYYTPMSWRKE